MRVATVRHEGEMLKEYIKKNKISADELCRKLSITRSMLSYYCRKEQLTDRFKAKLTAIGINRFTTSHEKEVFTPPHYRELKEEIALLNQVIELQKEFINHITRNCRNGTCLNFVFDKRKN